MRPWGVYSLLLLLAVVAGAGGWAGEDGKPGPGVCHPECTKYGRVGLGLTTEGGHGGPAPINCSGVGCLQELRRRWLLQVRGCLHNGGSAAALPPLLPPPTLHLHSCRRRYHGRYCRRRHPPPQLPPPLPFPAFLAAVVQGGAWPNLVSCTFCRCPFGRVGEACEVDFLSPCRMTPDTPGKWCSGSSAAPLRACRPARRVLATFPTLKLLSDTAAAPACSLLRHTAHPQLRVHAALQGVLLPPRLGWPHDVGGVQSPL